MARGCSPLNAGDEQPDYLMESFWEAGSLVRPALPAVGAGRQPPRPAWSRCPPWKPSADVLPGMGLTQAAEKCMGNRARPRLASRSLCWLLQGREGQASPWKWTCGPTQSAWIDRGACCSHSPSQLWWLVTQSQQVLSHECRTPGQNHVLGQTER